jgi:large subunit ribosomal protein L31e
MSDSEIELDRTYTVPLTRAWIAPRYRRTARAVNVLKEFAERHMKSSEVKIDSRLNERLWMRGITKPPRRITVRMTKDEEGLITISLPKEEEKQSPPEEVPTSEQADLVSSTTTKEGVPNKDDIQSQKQEETEPAAPAGVESTKPKKAPRKTKASSK